MVEVASGHIKCGCVREFGIAVLEQESVRA